jgi:1-acyl-sn-glycerol-3-phosphate acyltransferase
MRQLRAACYWAYFMLVLLVFGLAGVPVRMFARKRALGLAKAWTGAALAGLQPICGITIEITGLEHLPRSGAALLASQHQSEFDTLVWLRLLTLPSYVMKQELTRIPLFGPLLVPAGMIPVDRSGAAGALRRLVQECMAARDAQRQIVIFPEGTRVPAGQRVELQPGIVAIAARLGLPVYPVATDSGRHWAHGRLAKYPGTIHIAIGPPILPGAARKALLTGIEAHWRSCEINGFAAVDNSVGHVTALAAADLPDAG